MTDPQYETFHTDLVVSIDTHTHHKNLKKKKKYLSLEIPMHSIFYLIFLFIFYNLFNFKKIVPTIHNTDVMPRYNMDFWKICF